MEATEVSEAIGGSWVLTSPLRSAEANFSVGNFMTGSSWWEGMVRSAIVVENYTRGCRDGKV